MRKCLLSVFGLAVMMVASMFSHSGATDVRGQGGASDIEWSARQSELIDPLYLWRGIVPFGQDLPEKPAYRAFSEFTQYFSAMDEWRRNLYLSNEQQPFWMQFRNKVQDYDVEALLASGYRKAKFSGRWEASERMSFSFNPQESFSPINRMGELDAKFSFFKGSLGDDYVSTELDTSIHLGTILFDEFLHSIEAVNVLLSPERVETVPIISETSSFAVSFHPEMTEYDKRLLSLFYASIPRLMATLQSVSEFEGLGEQSILQDGRAATRIQHRQRIQLDRLKESFPGTYYDFKDLLKSLSFRSAFYLEDGSYLGSVQYDASTKLFLGDLTIVEGGFALRNTQDELLDRVILPSELSSLRYFVDNELDISLFGVDVKVEGLKVRAHYSAKQSHYTESLQSEEKQADIRPATLSMQMREMPTIDVSGAFLYFLPTWLIDLLIPGTIETLIAEAFEDLIKGNKGEGFQLKMTFLESNGEHVLNLKAKAELPLEVIQELLKIEKNREGDEARMYRTLRQDLRQDFTDKAQMVFHERDEYSAVLRVLDR